MNLRRIVAQGTEDGRAVEDVTDIQVNGEVDGAVDGEASVPEAKANDEQAEEKAKEVQVCVRVACDVWRVACGV